MFPEARRVASGETVYAGVVGRVALLAVVVGIFGVLPTNVGTADYRGISLGTVAKVQSGVAVVEGLHCNGQPIRVRGLTATGSGFLVGRRLVMTAEHVVSDFISDHRRICRHRVWLGGSWYSVTRETVWAQHGKEMDRRGIDVATFELARAAPGHLFQFARRGPQVGSTVAALGFPFGLPFSVAQGHVRREFLDYGIPTFASLIVIEGGNSGGPIINAKGEAVGIVSRIFPVTNPNAQGANLDGGIDLARWWGTDIVHDLCLAHPTAGVRGCAEATAGSTTSVKVPIDLPPLR